MQKVRKQVTAEKRMIQVSQKGLDDLFAKMKPYQISQSSYQTIPTMTKLVRL